jgi:hypothetical protein
MNEESNQLLSQQITNRLYELCNYDEIIDNLVKDKKSKEGKINNIDIQYLLRNDNVKDMLTFFVNKIKSSSELQKIREKIKIYSIYKEKIDKISELEKKKQDLINKIKEKNSKLLSEKERLNQFKSENIIIKKSLEGYRDNINLINSKNQILSFSKKKTDILVKDFENSLVRTQEFRKEISSSLMVGKEYFEEYLKINLDNLEKKMKDERFKDKKTLPFVRIY